MELKTFPTLFCTSASRYILKHVFTVYISVQTMLVYILKCIGG